MGAQPAHDVQAGALLGAPAVGADGAALGRIADLAMDCDESGVDYAVLSFDPALGLDHKLYTYPLDKVARGARGAAVLEITRRALLEDRANQLVGLALRQYDANAFIPQPRCLRATEFLGKTLPGIGRVVDFRVDLASGQVRSAVAESDGRRKAVPMDALQASR